MDRRIGRRRTPAYTGCLNLSRRQSAMTAGTLTDEAGMCLAAPTPASATVQCRLPEQAVPTSRGDESELITSLDRDSR
jgi:hypothetical protein